VLALAGGALLLPSAAAAATKSVWMGVPTPDQKTFERASADVNDFFPDGVTIHQGDAIRFVPSAFHTVDIPPRGGKALPLIVPSGVVTGATDAAGNPFWFNGRPRLNFNPRLARPIFGTRQTYNGTRRIESGLPMTRRPKSFTVTFRRTGNFTYFCDVHPGMKAVVHVRPASRPVPSAAADRARVRAQVRRNLASARALARPNAGPNTIDVGNAGRDGVEVFAFLPQSVTVATGTTVRFQMTPRSFDAHTATTGPGNPEKEPSSYLGMLAASFASPTLNPIAVYPSDPPPGPAALTPASHGNGFWNSGVIDAARSTPLPSSSTVTFAQAGTYQFYCLIHPFMHGTVTVT
jgi:plastocyanin